MAHQQIGVGTVAITRGSRAPILNDGLLVVVTNVGHFMNPNRYSIQQVTGEPFPLVGNDFYKHRRARITGTRLVPIEGVDPDECLDAVATTNVGGHARPAPVHASRLP